MTHGEGQVGVHSWAHAHSVFLLVGRAEQTSSNIPFPGKPVKDAVLRSGIVREAYAWVHAGLTFHGTLVGIGDLWNKANSATLLPWTGRNLHVLKTVH